MLTVDQLINAVKTLSCPKCGLVIGSRGPGWVCLNAGCDFWITFKTIELAIRKENEEYWAKFNRNWNGREAAK